MSFEERLSHEKQVGDDIEAIIEKAYDLQDIINVFIDGGLEDLPTDAVIEIERTVAELKEKIERINQERAGMRKQVRKALESPRGKELQSIRRALADMHFYDEASDELLADNEIDNIEVNPISDEDIKPYEDSYEPNLVLSLKVLRPFGYAEFCTKVSIYYNESGEFEAKFSDDNIKGEVKALILKKLSEQLELAKQ